MESLQAVLAIVLIDLALSGDNALLIGMAARRVPADRRLTVIVLGGSLAVAIRLVATAAVSLLLEIPYLQLVAGALLIVIAYRLVLPTEATGRTSAAAPTTMRDAIATIVLADLAMSLENVLGVAAAAHGDLPLLFFGFALSIPIVLFGSRVVVWLLERYPVVVWLGAFALVWTAADMILEDPTLGAHVPDHWAVEVAVTIGLLGMVAFARQMRAGRMVRR